MATPQSPPTDRRNVSQPLGVPAYPNRAPTKRGRPTGKLLCELKRYEQLRMNHAPTCGVHSKDKKGSQRQHGEYSNTCSSLTFRAPQRGWKGCRQPPTLCRYADHSQGRQASSEVRNGFLQPPTERDGSDHGLIQPTPRVEYGGSSRQLGARPRPNRVTTPQAPREAWRDCGRWQRAQLHPNHPPSWQEFQAGRKGLRQRPRAHSIPNRMRASRTHRVGRKGSARWQCAGIYRVLRALVQQAPLTG